MCLVTMLLPIYDVMQLLVDDEDVKVAKDAMDEVCSDVCT